MRGNAATDRFAAPNQRDGRAGVTPPERLAANMNVIGRASFRWLRWLAASSLAFWCASQTGAAVSARAAQTPVRGGVLHVAFAAEPPTLDWMSTTAYACREVAWHIFEQLYTIDRDYHPVPMLADGFPHASADGKTITIAVRRGVKFHDGSTMTARDVVASIRRWGQRTGAGKAAFKAIVDVRAVDDGTLQIALNAPFSPLLNDLADVSSALIVLPAAIALDAASKPLTNAQLIGTGPFRFDSWEPGQTLKLKRFDAYTARTDHVGGLGGRKTAYLDEIDYDIVKDAQVRLAGLQTGQFQYAQALSEDSLAQVKATPGVRPDAIDPYAWAALVPNKARGPLANVTIRRALALALDRASAAKGAFGPDDFWYLDGSIFFPAQKGLYSATGTQPYRERNIALAKKLLMEAHYSGTPLVYMTTKDYAWMDNLAQVVVPQLQAAGFTVDVQIYDWPTLLTKRNAETGWDLFATGFNIALDPSAMIWVNPQWAGSYQSSKMQGLLASWSHAVSAPEKRRLIAQMQQTVYEEFPVIKIADYKQLNAYETRLRGYTPYMDFTFWNTWLGPA